jgi:hypothetical protein
MRTAQPAGGERGRGDVVEVAAWSSIDGLALAEGDDVDARPAPAARAGPGPRHRLVPVRDTHGLDHASHHRSQFGENHKGIKEFFPNSQLFGFTGTPIFEDNATVKQIEGNVATLRTTKDLFQKELHA